MSGLMAEFREQDSMINSDWDDSDSGSESGSSTRSRPGLTNSLVETADMLLDLIKVTERPPGSELPRVTLRITRIPEDCDDDSRFRETFRLIKSKGVHLVFGDLSEIPLDSLPRPEPEKNFIPNRRICLDPTALMAFCSDLLHHPLPTSKSEAMKRFFRPREALQNRPGGKWANGPGRSGPADEMDQEWRGQSQNSRELVKNVLEEMEDPLIPYIRDTLEEIIQKGEKVEWWTTQEAAQYLKEALGSESVVGKGMEQQRMRRMLGLEDGDFFEGSRYKAQGAFIDFRLNIFPSSDFTSTERAETTISNETQPPPTSFHRSLANVAKSCVEDYYSHINQPTGKAVKELPNFLKPQRIPTPKVAQLSLPFPIVSLITLFKGCQEGMTVLMMGNVVLRDLFSQPRWKCPGWFQSSYEIENARFDCGEEANVQVAVWMLPYRSLGEGKRVKFENGDFSYPTHAKEAEQ